ncbi:MAG: response regulator [Zoogloeaceae bacterium]|jgi:signal transduction histidine kinase/CheY-like chemotaxis protein/purine-cytosine permease-like protein|nr:response regulator [Zoogloeaceae bacterium]
MSFPLPDDPPEPAVANHPPPLLALKTRRKYNRWVAQEAIEDYALRYTPPSARRRSVWKIAHAAFGGAAAFMALELLGASIMLSAGAASAFWAIIAASVTALILSIPLSLAAARHGVDMDLLTRGAGFGYLGSTITSLIYAFCTFFFFALEAMIMAYALEHFMGMPLPVGYLLSSCLVIPLVVRGVAALSAFQRWTFALWLPLLLLPYFFIAQRPELLDGISRFAGTGDAGFDWARFAVAFSVSIAIITQLSEQADFLRFMPPEPGSEAPRRQRWRWRLAVIAGGVGWLPFAVLKMLGGMLLLWLALPYGLPAGRLPDPGALYSTAFSLGVDPKLAGWLALLLVILSQLKINTTNAYAGSLAWSNFFSRLTHSHPGRAVWAVFNVLISLALMELGISAAIDRALVLYSNVAVAWMVAVLADLLINKPLGLSPPGIEFRRAYLHDVNPVGVGALAIASLLSILTFMGVFGEYAVPYSTLVSALTALIASPAIAWATQGRYYLARRPPPPAPETEPAAEGQCAICGNTWHVNDLVDCPAYGGQICSLCCGLDNRCDDLCKPRDARLESECLRWFSWLIPRRLSELIRPGLGGWLLFMGAVLLLSAFLMSFLYYHSLDSLAGNDAASAHALRHAFLHMFAMWALVFAIVGWWGVLLTRSQRISHEESLEQNKALLREITARQAAEGRAEAESRAKSRYVSTISHELRTPLNSILGYVYLLDADPTVSDNHRRELSIIRAAGEHMTAVIGEAQDFTKIEHGKLELAPRDFDFSALLAEVVALFAQQAKAKDIAFEFQPEGPLPRHVHADDKRIRQVLINLLGNALKFTKCGKVSLQARLVDGQAELIVRDTGIGISTELLANVFEPFSQGAPASQIGTGLGLPISKHLAELMGGSLTVNSCEGHGSVFTAKIPLKILPTSGKNAALRGNLTLPSGFSGGDRRILIADDAHDDRAFLRQLLLSLGFTVAEAQSGEDVLDMLGAFHPDLVILDLSMPGMGGWKTVEALNRQTMAHPPQVAILSANAFERPNAPRYGIAKEAFWLKPLSIENFLAWLAKSLGIHWQYATQVSAALTPPPPPLVTPPEEDLNKLFQSIASGYPKGVFITLDKLEKTYPDCSPFAEKLRALTRDFRLEEAERLVRQALLEKDGGNKEGSAVA